MLTYVELDPYRREIKGMRNLQESRHDLARHLFHGRGGDLYRAYQQGMEDPLTEIDEGAPSLTCGFTHSDCMSGPGRGLRSLRSSGICCHHESSGATRGGKRWKSATQQFGMSWRWMCPGW